MPKLKNTSLLEISSSNPIFSLTSAGKKDKNQIVISVNRGVNRKLFGLPIDLKIIGAASKKKQGVTKKKAIWQPAGFGGLEDAVFPGRNFNRMTGLLTKCSFRPIE